MLHLDDSLDDHSHFEHNHPCEIEFLLSGSENASVVGRCAKQAGESWEGVECANKVDSR